MNEEYIKGLERAVELIDDGDGSMSSMRESYGRELCQNEIRQEIKALREGIINP